MTVPLAFIQEDDLGDYEFLNLPAFLPVSAVFSADHTMGAAKVSSAQFVSHFCIYLLLRQKENTLQDTHSRITSHSSRENKTLC